MDLGFDVVVTITGIVLVFLILVLLPRRRPLRLLRRHPPQSPLPLRYSRLRPLLR